MKPISPRPILTLSILTAANQITTKIPHFVAFSTQPSPSNWRRQEEESRAVRVSVWWDFENCNVPVNGNAFRVAQSITNAIRANGIKGPIEITAFGDVMQISRSNQEALSATGINLTHVPSGGKNSADRSLLVDLMYWVSKNPPPAHLLLISGDRDFAGILHRLRMSNYNILLASPDSAPNVLCSAATIMWQWNSLLKGENLTGKLFNQPPDGPYNSWYGHYKAPVVDPFAVTEQSSCSSVDQSSLLAIEPKVRQIPKAVKQSSCSGVDQSALLAIEPKVRPIPKAIMKHICLILKSHPEGIHITHLRTELTKSNVDRDLYGHKKFSRFLSAMPHILELHEDDGSILVRLVKTNLSEKLCAAASEEPKTTNGASEACSGTKTDSKKSYSNDVAERSTVGSCPSPKVKGELTNLQEDPKVGRKNESSVSMKTQDVKMEATTNLPDQKKEKIQTASLPKRNIQEMQEKHREVKLKNQPRKDEVAPEIKLKNQPHKDKVDPAPPVVEIEDLSGKNENKMLETDNVSSASEFGIFRRMWMKLFGSNHAKHDEAISGKNTVIQKTPTPCQSSEAVRPALFSPSSHEALVNGEIAQSVDATSDTSSQNSSSSKQSSSWFKFWSSPKHDEEIEKTGETAEHLHVHVKQLDEKKEEDREAAHHFEVKSKQPEIFSTESFWKVMESFIGSSESSAIFSKSRNRENLAENLQKQGPPVLGSLSMSNILHLIDLLISDMKWVEERDFGRYPFKLIYPAEKCVQNSRLSSSGGLSHIFSDRRPQDSKERKHQNYPHAGVPQPIVHKGPISKPKSEVLADCQKLVDQIVKEYPEGFNVGGFRKLFMEKYGYALDIQKLGHEKLVTLLNIMPGVVLESNLILPVGALKNLDRESSGLPIQETKVRRVVTSHDESSTISKKDDDSDSSWDELGPLDTSGSEKDEGDAGLTDKSRKGTEQRLQYYEPLREDEFSDSDDETSYTRSEDEKKSKLPAESALLDILDSWHGQKENGSRSKTNLVDSVETDSEISVTSSSTKNEAAVTQLTRKLKSQKSYSFVKEPPIDRKDKLIDGILGSLKKSGDKSADSQISS